MKVHRIIFRFLVKLVSPTNLQVAIPIEALTYQLHTFLDNFLRGLVQANNSTTPIQPSNSVLK